MSVGSIIDGGELLRPEKIGPFGSFPPSLLSPNFSYKKFVPIVLPSNSIEPILPGNSNRWAIIMGVNATGEMFLCPSPFVTQVEPLMAVYNINFAVLTFADIGTLICQPFWLYSSAVPVGMCYEITYKPKGCS
jgi:hypothetical protein